MLFSHQFLVHPGFPHMCPLKSPGIFVKTIQRGQGRPNLAKQLMCYASRPGHAPHKVHTAAHKCSYSGNPMQSRAKSQCSQMQPHALTHGFQMPCATPGRGNWSLESSAEAVPAPFPSRQAATNTNAQVTRGLWLNWPEPREGPCLLKPMSITHKTQILIFLDTCMGHVFPDRFKQSALENWWAKGCATAAGLQFRTGQALALALTRRFKTRRAA